MSKNIRWSLDDIKKKGLVQNQAGDYVPVKSLVNTGKVEKLPSLIERAIPLVDQMTEAQLKMKLYRERGIVLVEPHGETFLLPTGAYIDVLYKFNISPCAAPRMTKRDAIFLDPNHIDPKKRQRACVTRYFAFKREFIWLAQQNDFKLSETLRVLFIIPFPKYWNKKKRETYLNQPHKQRPDVDNMTKSVMDSSGVDDGYVWDIRAIKLWGEKGQIIIF